MSTAENLPRDCCQLYEERPRLPMYNRSASQSERKPGVEVLSLFMTFI